MNNKEQRLNFWQNFKQWFIGAYKNNKTTIFCLLVIFLVWLILIAVATSGFASPASTANKVFGGIGPDGEQIYHFSPEAFVIGNFAVQWYAIFILLGIISAASLGYFEIKKKNFDLNILWDGLLIFVPAAIVGLRLYYVFVNWGDGWTFLDIIGWNGSTIALSGLAIHGAIIVVAIGIIPFCKWKKINFWWFIDVVLPCFFIGQAIGRWGNFMNAELYGPMIQSENYINFLPRFITEQLTIRPEQARNGLQTGPRHPTFLYESILNLVGFTVVLFFKNKRVTKLGEFGCFYFIWYGIIRGALIEPLRYFGSPVTGEVMTIPGTDFPINVLLSIVLVLAGISIIVLRRTLKMYRENPYYTDYFREKLIINTINDERT